MRGRGRAAAGLGTVVLAAAGWALGPGGAAGALDGGGVTPTTLLAPGSTTSSTTTSTTDGTTTTTDPGPATSLPVGTTTSTTADGSSTTSSTTPDSSTTVAGQSGSSTTSSSVPPADPRLEAEAGSVRRSGESSTAGLLAALSPLTRLGLTQEQTALVGFGSFPVAGPATYTDDWLEYRSTPTPHLHEGIDIDAAQGTPLRSPTDGVLTYSNSDPDGYGLTAIVTQADGTTFVLAHMSATVLGLSSGSQVKTGQVIGFVGSSGDATGPHCHFEVHPYGGAGVDGKPLLDQWLAQATASAPALIASFQDARSPADQPRVEPVPVSVPEVPPGAPRPHSRLSTTATLRAPAWSPSAAVRVGGLAGLLALSGGGTVVAVRRRRRPGGSPGPAAADDPGVGEGPAAVGEPGGPPPPDG